MEGNLSASCFVRIRRATCLLVQIFYNGGMYTLCEPNNVVCHLFHFSFLVSCCCCVATWSKAMCPIVFFSGQCRSLLPLTCLSASILSCLFSLFYYFCLLFLDIAQSHEECRKWDDELNMLIPLNWPTNISTLLYGCNSGKLDFYLSAVKFPYSTYHLFPFLDIHFSFWLHRKPIKDTMGTCEKWGLCSSKSEKVVPSFLSYFLEAATRILSTFLHLSILSFFHSLVWKHSLRQAMLDPFFFYKEET